ncbi:hypothetical protein [Desulfobotulus sp.]|jgi:hypothetical protein|nr:hypothetical protein [Desulfobotulus sp.]MDY0162294.1 hypothetical protein [Desulfobotulus sp.]
MTFKEKFRGWPFMKGMQAILPMPFFVEKILALKRVRFKGNE